MPQRRQLCRHLRAVAPFELKPAIVEKGARGIHGGLQIHAVVAQVCDKAGMAAGLVPAAPSMPGMMVCSGRLPGPNSLGWPSRRLKPQPRLCSSRPNFGLARPDPKLWKIE